MKKIYAVHFAFLAATACVSPPSESLYQALERIAVDPELRASVCTVVLDDLKPEGLLIARSYRGDEAPTIRARCYQWLIRMESPQQNDWLVEALADPSSRVQALAVLSADRVEAWNSDVWASLWDILQTCKRGHLFKLAANALVARGGPPAAQEVFDIVNSRSSGWLPYALTALAMHPQEAFREAFETAAISEHWDPACLGNRSLAQLDALNEHGEQAKKEVVHAPGQGINACITTAEFHDLWRAPSLSHVTPEVLAWDEFVVRLRKTRVIILGEMHGDLAGRATQIAVLAELSYAKLGKVVLVCERAVLEFQEPIMAAAKQHRLEVRMLESETQAQTASPATRDEVARQALAEMAVAEPETIFVVCYGENHRRSFHTAVSEANVPCLSIALSPADGMLSSAMHAVKGRISNLCFGYPGDIYFIPSGSYATLLGNPGMDEAFLTD